MKARIFFYYETIDGDNESTDTTYSKTVIDVETFSHLDRIERFLLECFQLYNDVEAGMIINLIKVVVVPIYEEDSQHIMKHYPLFAQYRGNFFFYDNKLIAP